MLPTVSSPCLPSARSLSSGEIANCSAGTESRLVPSLQSACLFLPEPTERTACLFGFFVGLLVSLFISCFCSVFAKSV